jgi:hypothetical protein
MMTTTFVSHTQRQAKRFGQGVLAAGLLLSLTFAGLAPSAFAARDLVKPFDFAGFEANPAAYSEDYIKEVATRKTNFGGKNSLKEVTKVGITGFQILFPERVFEHTEGSTLGGIRRGQWTDNRWVLEVQQLSPQLRQQITDAAYEAFSEELKALGLEVLPMQTLLNSEPFSEWVAETTTGKDMQGSCQKKVSFGENEVWAVTPCGLPLEAISYGSSMFAGAKPGLVEGFKATGNQWSVQRAQAKLGKAYKEFGDFTPVTVTLFMDMKKVKSIGGFIPNNPFKSSSEDMTFSLSLGAGSVAKFYPQQEDAKQPKFEFFRQVSYQLGYPVHVVEALGDVSFDGHNVKAQAASVAANLAFRSLGLPTMRVPTQKRTYTLLVNEDAYNTSATQAVEVFTTMIRTEVAEDLEAVQPVKAPAREEATVDEASPKAEEAESQPAAESDSTAPLADEVEAEETDVQVVEASSVEGLEEEENTEAGSIEAPSAEEAEPQAPAPDEAKTE